MSRIKNNPNPNDDDLPLLQPVLRRQLSAAYRDPFTGLPTQDDPSSYQGEEREAYEKALMRDLPHTGYAAGLRRNSDRARASCRDALSFFSKDDDANGSAPAPLLAANPKACVK